MKDINKVCGSCADWREWATQMEAQYANVCAERRRLESENAALIKRRWWHFFRRASKSPNASYKIPGYGYAISDNVAVVFLDADILTKEEMGMIKQRMTPVFVEFSSRDMRVKQMDVQQAVRRSA